MFLDFKYNEATGNLEKVGYYSHCEEREATREEVSLWRRVEELEALLDERCPPDTLALLKAIQATSGFSRVHVNPNDFALLLQYAAHRMTNDGDLGFVPRLEEGLHSGVWVGIDSDLPVGAICCVPAPL
jgi:hypothetical protein